MSPPLLCMKNTFCLLLILTFLMIIYIYLNLILFYKIDLKDQIRIPLQKIKILEKEILKKIQF